jgi:hypothetical protein
MKVVSADSSCSVVWWGAKAAYAEVSTGSVEASKARLVFKKYMEEFIELGSTWYAILNLGQSCSDQRSYAVVPTSHILHFRPPHEEESHNSCNVD